jgi:hypothetical protein
MFQVIVGPQRSRRGAVPQAEHHDRIVRGAGDDQRQVLVLS